MNQKYSGQMEIILWYLLTFAFYKKILRKIMDVLNFIGLYVVSVLVVLLSQRAIYIKSEEGYIISLVSTITQWMTL